jgi:hypothetical protein
LEEATSLMPRNAYELLHQGSVWRPRGEDWTPIDQMTPEHRLSTANFLMRRAKAMMLRSEIDEMLSFSGFGYPHDDMGLDFGDAPRVNPTVWMAERPLYRALVAGLPEGGTAYAALARRARHWSTCPFRLADGHPDRPANAVCACPATTPEAAAEAAGESTP